MWPDDRLMKIIIIAHIVKTCCFFILFYQTIENRLDSSKRRFAASKLQRGKRYIVTIYAFRGSKRSKVVETFFKTGQHSSTKNNFLLFVIVFYFLIWLSFPLLLLVALLYPFPMDCGQIMKNGNKNNGVYTVYINNNQSKPIQVYCDMTTDGGGWLVYHFDSLFKLCRILVYNAVLWKSKLLLRFCHT